MKRNETRLLRALLALALAAALLPLNACRSSDSPLRVSLILKTTVNTAEFWSQVMDGVNTAADELGVKLTVSAASAETAVDEQIGLMRDAIAAKPDAILLVASDRDRLVPAVEDAAAAGIPVVTMDSDVDTPSRAGFVASDNLRIGRSLGEMLGQFLPDGGKVAILTPSLISSSGMDRVEGVRGVIDAAGKYDLLGVYNCENDLETARSLVDSILAEHPDADAFVCANEVCNIGAALTLTQAGLDGKVTVIGCDNSWRQIQYLERDAIQGIVIQRPFNIGYVAVEEAVKAARGETVPLFTEIGCVKITRDNMYNSDNQKLLFPFKSSN